eukprot:scaffold34167_cov70-Phaeocystis_antarctica.AAC.3
MLVSRRRPEATPRSSTTSASSPEGTGAEVEAPAADESSLWRSRLGRKRPRYLRTSASLSAPPTAVLPSLSPPRSSSRIAALCFFLGAVRGLAADSGSTSLRFVGVSGIGAMPGLAGALRAGLKTRGIL